MGFFFFGKKKKKKVKEPSYIEKVCGFIYFYETLGLIDYLDQTPFPKFNYFQKQGLIRD
jgi:hypothetical protein